MRINRRVLIIVSIVLLALVGLFAFVFISREDSAVNDPTNNDTADTLLAQELAEEAARGQERTEKFNSATSAIRDEDYAQAAQTSYEVARDESASTKKRLQAYSTCVYSARLSDNNELKETCYTEGLELSNDIGDQEVVGFWQQNLEEQYTGINTSPASGGDSIADENAIQ